MKRNVMKYMIATVGALVAGSNLYAAEMALPDSTHVWIEGPPPSTPPGLLLHGNPFVAGPLGGEFVIHTAQENRVGDPPKEGGGEPEGLSLGLPWMPSGIPISVDGVEGSAGSSLDETGSASTVLLGIGGTAESGIGLGRLPSPSIDGVVLSTAARQSAIPSPGALALFGLAILGGSSRRRRP